MALAACGGGGSSGGSSPPAQTPSSDIPVITAAGTAAGNPVAQPVDAGGGTVAEPTSGAAVRVVPGTFAASTTVTVQPVTNLLPDGVGMGIAITTSQAPLKPLVVRFPYPADVADPSGIRLAARASDGSWRLLGPTAVDTANGLLIAALPTTLPTASALRAGSGPAAAAAPSSQNVAALETCRMVPAAKTIKAGDSVDLLPRCKMWETSDCDADPICAADAPESCWGVQFVTCLVLEEHDMLNQKPGFTRSWSVVADGTVTPKAISGATYKAPSLTPETNPVQVIFSSFKDGAALSQHVTPKALITVLPDHYHVKVSFVGSAYPVCTFGVADLTDGFEFDLSGDGGTGTNFTNQTTVYGTVSPASGTGTVTLTGAFELIIAARNVVDTLVAPGGKLYWTVAGLAQNAPGCTWTVGDTTVTDPGGPPPVSETPIIDINFNPTDFGTGNTLTLPPQDLGRLTATVTLTR